jgi:hypothetical protein
MKLYAFNYDLIGANVLKSAIDAKDLPYSPPITQY